MMIAVGSADEIKDQSTKVINGLESAGKVIRNILTSQTGNSTSTVDEWLKGDTWFDLLMKRLITGLQLNQLSQNPVTRKTF